jgi:hypothetical protein
MNPRERVKAALNFQPVDRLPAIEWAPWWDQTVKRWRGEGLPAHLEDPFDIRAHFGLDPLRYHWIRPKAKGCPAPASHGAPIVTSRDDYLRIKQFLYPKPAFDPKVFERWAADHREGRTAVWFSLDGFFWFPRTLFGIEPHLYAFYDQPELMQEINSDLAEFSLRAIEELCAIMTPEFMTFGEDLSYNHGPMLSKECFDEFLLPHYRRVVPALKEHGIIPMVDSDGDIEPVIPWFQAAGIEGILPLERMAGVDVARIRKNHPRWKMLGAYDKTIMHLGEARVRAEFERLLPTMQSGGFIPSVDHQTPPGVSLADYRSYVKLLFEYCEKGAKR